MANAPQVHPRRLRCAAALLVAGWAAAAQSREAPLWEYGLGAGAVAFEDYRGANTTHVYPLPIPYFAYNGKFLKADREGVRGTLLHESWFEINLSGNATTPVRSNRARSGMPNLKSTLELGPSLDLHLFRSEDRKMKFDIRMPLRAVFTVESPPRMIGWTFTPRFALDFRDPFGLPGWHLGLLSGPLFAERRYDDYFYSVAPQYVTLSRPAYRAKGGYAGTQAIVAVSKRYPRVWVGAYVRYDTLAGAAFIDSPLVQTNRYWSAGIGFSWMIRKSAKTVEVPD